MKPNTMVFARFSSTGKPRFNKETSGTVAEVMQELIRWVFECHMGTSLKITFARTAEELRIATGSGSGPDSAATAEDFMAELLAQIDQPTLALNPDSDSED
jgi:hypothetical protein